MALRAPLVDLRRPLRDAGPRGREPEPVEPQACELEAIAEKRRRHSPVQTPRRSLESVDQRVERRVAVPSGQTPFATGDPLGSVVLRPLLARLVVVIRLFAQLFWVALRPRLVVLPSACLAISVSLLIQVLPELQAPLRLLVQRHRWRLAPPRPLEPHLLDRVRWDVGFAIQHRLVRELHRVVRCPLRLLGVWLPTALVYVVAAHETARRVVGPPLAVVALPTPPPRPSVVITVALRRRREALEEFVRPLLDILQNRASQTPRVKRRQRTNTGWS